MSADDIELPPSQFSNTTHDLKSQIDWRKWRESPEWKLFIAGWNAACEEMSRQARNAKNMSEPEHKVFGDKWDMAGRGY